MKQQAYDLLRAKGTFNFRDLFSICLGKVFSNRIEFCEHLGHYKHWDVDLTKGILLVDDKKFNIECIGTSSTKDGMWFSAELERQIPDDKVNMIIKSRTLMKQLNLTNLAETKIKLNDVITDEKLAIIYTAFCSNDNCTYFVANSGDVQIFLHVKDFEGDNTIKELTKPIGSHKFIPRIMEMMSKYDVDHKLLIKSFLIHNNCQILENKEFGTKLAGVFGDKEIGFTFDENGRFDGVFGEVN